MKCLITLLLFVLTTTADKRCHGIYFNEKYFNINIIKDGVNMLHDLVFNRNENTIYFTFELISDPPTRALGYINLDTYTAHVIDGIRNATAIAIDQSTNKIFVGGSDGLFKINDKKLPERLPIQDDIRSLHFNNGLYFTNRRRQAFKFEDGFAAAVRELQGLEVDRLILDDDNNLFFLNGKMLFRVKLGTRAVNTHERHVVTAIGTDIHSKAYACTKNGVYVYNKYKYVLDKVADMNNLKALSFNRANEPVYAVADLIARLESNSLPCFED